MQITSLKIYATLSRKFSMNMSKGFTTTDDLIENLRYIIT